MLIYTICTIHQIRIVFPKFLIKKYGMISRPRLMLWHFFLMQFLFHWVLCLHSGRFFLLINSHDKTNIVAGMHNYKYHIHIWNFPCIRIYGLFCKYSVKKITNSRIYESVGLIGRELKKKYIQM